MSFKLFRSSIFAFMFFFVSGCTYQEGSAPQVSVDSDASESWTADQGKEFLLDVLRRQQELWDTGTIEDNASSHRNRSDDNRFSFDSFDVGYSGRAHLYTYRRSQYMSSDDVLFYFMMRVDSDAILTAYQFVYRSPIASMVGIGRGTRSMYVAHVPGASFCWGASTRMPLRIRNGWSFPVTREAFNNYTRQTVYEGAACFGGDPRFNKSGEIMVQLRYGGVPVDDFSVSDGVFVFETRSELSRFATYMSSVYGVRIAEPI